MVLYKRMLREIDSLTFHYGITEIIGQATQIYIILHPLTALLLFYDWVGYSCWNLFFLSQKMSHSINTSYIWSNHLISTTLW